MYDQSHKITIEREGSNAMKKAKKYILLLIGIAGIFVFSVAYHNHLVRKAVLEDTNSERFYQESEENIEKKTKLEVMSGSYSNLSNEQKSSSLLVSAKNLIEFIGIL